MQKRLSLTIVVLLTPLLAPLLFGTEPFVFDQEDIGRILYRGDGGGGTFLVLDRVAASGRLACHELGHTKSLSVTTAGIRKTIFFDDAPPFDVTQYALVLYMNGRDDAPEVALARVIGDTSGRMDVLSRYEQARLRFFQRLPEEMRYSAEKKHDPAIRDDNMLLLLEDSPPFETVCKAADNHDFLLAAALAQDYFRRLEKDLRRCFQTENGRLNAQTLLNRQKSELTERFAEHVRTTGARRNQFRQLLPLARSLWSEAPPSSYDGFLRVMHRSHQAYLKLDELSPHLEFQDWANAVLDVLLVIEKSPAARELEEKFDRVMQEKKRAGNAASSANRQQKKDIP